MKLNTNLSFTNFNQPVGTFASNNNTTTEVRRVTPGQVSYYNTLCKQRNMTPKEIEEFNFDTLSAEIKRLQSFYPASPAQIELVKTKVQSLTELLGSLNFTDEQKDLFATKDGVIYNLVHAILTQGSYDVTPLLPGLTGGREGTASALIGAIIDLEKKLASSSPVTDKQIEMLVSMFFCPDIAFEDYNVLRQVKLEDGLWRKPSPQEFAEMIKENFNKQEASAFIDKYRGAFYDWKNTRAKLEQISYIKTLEARMSNDSHLSEKKQASTIDGTVIDIDSTSTKREYIKGESYTLSTDEELLQYSVEQASNYIDQLKSELDKREATTITGEEVQIDRSNTDLASLQEIDEETLNNIMFSLQAIAGYEDEELTKGVDEDKIRGFVKDMIQHGDITYWGIMEVAENSIPLQKILLNM